MSKIDEARKILKAFGLATEQQNEMSALTLLALCHIGPTGNWKDASRHSLTITKGVMAYAAEVYNRKYAPNTRETFRRHVLHQFVQAGLAEYNPDDTSLPTNSPKAHYAISKAALAAVRSWGSSNWRSALVEYKSTRQSLITLYRKERASKLVPLMLASGKELNLSPGEHNRLQADVIRDFGPRFAPGSKLIYLGDAVKKNLVVDSESLAKLGVSLTDHDKLPDVILYDDRRQWIFLIEVVTSHGPMNEKRVIELKEMFARCATGLVFVSAFPTLAVFRKYLKEVAWETEVWIRETPDHLIHFNGDKFLGPYDMIMPRKPTPE